MQASPDDPRAFGQRLSRRLEESGWGYQEFHRRVREHTGGARGSSYGSVWSYVNGKVEEPRPTIVSAMADVLGVTREWLLTGRGPRTVAEAALAPLDPEPDDEPAVERSRRLVSAMSRARRHLGERQARLLARRDGVVEALVVDLLESDGRRFDSYAEGEVAEALELVTWLMTLPMELLDARVARNGSIDGEAYVMAMATALRLALPAAPHGRPQPVLSRLRRLRSAFQGAEPSAPRPPSGTRGASVAPH